eukprot:TRINITY_DN1606_c0_g2_i3.p1 TRINITY_DN1606_c0_g2~~TRINITY_DN1606_c0_g2_i3.p1  ORF type:complete len:205 (+),score=-17.56 TRINITY_DN1606_c0_g2_i3:3-617(+)
MLFFFNNRRQMASAAIMTFFQTFLFFYHLFIKMLFIFITISLSIFILQSFIILQNISPSFFRIFKQMLFSHNQSFNENTFFILKIQNKHIKKIFINIFSIQTSFHNFSFIFCLTIFQILNQYFFLRIIFVLLIQCNKKKKYRFNAGFRFKNLVPSPPLLFTNCPDGTSSRASLWRHKYSQRLDFFQKIEFFLKSYKPAFLRCLA